MSKKVGLPDFIKSRHDLHFVEEISTRTRTAIIRNIPIEKIVPNVMQPRKDLGDLSELAASIKEKGIIEPIIVRTKDGKFEIIAGERRFRAAELAGLKEIPCIENDVPDNEALEITLIENIQRKDLNIFETAFSFKSLMEIYGYTHQDIGQKIGKSRVTVTEMLRLTDLPADIIKKCQDLNINSKTFLLELVKLEDRNRMLDMLEQYADKPFSRDMIKALRKKQLPETAAAKPQPFRFKFISEDKSVKIDFRFKSDDVNRDSVISALEQLIKDIRENKIEAFKS